MRPRRAREGDGRLRRRRARRPGRTTIVESGLDIPRANTMFVDRADAFGLAQLYQLRGRIGRVARSARTATCWCRRARAHHRRGAAPARGAAAVHRARRRLPDRVAGPRDPRRRRAARRASSRARSPRSASTPTCKMLEEAVAELRGEPIHTRDRSRAHRRRARLHPRRLRARHRPAPRALQAAVGGDDEDEVRAVARRDRRPLRPGARRGRAARRADGRQGARPPAAARVALEI